MASYLPILTFHMIDDKSSVLSYSPELFRRFMDKLYRRGYRTLNLTNAVEGICTGKPFAERSFVLTFDDGYASVFEKAFPVLEEYGMTATVFLTVGDSNVSGSNNRLPSLNETRMLGWREIREMRIRGIDFGSHTLTHPDLSRLDMPSIEYEMRKSKEIIEDNLGMPVSSFAYPYGKYNEDIIEAVQQYFICACSDELGFLTKESNPYSLERVDTYYLRSEKLVDLMFTGWFPLYVLLRGIPRRIRRTVEGR
jgi:peptidoglycan/xylan/chitin deacetylase (PgdA/CDA1 family)